VAQVRVGFAPFGDGFAPHPGAPNLHLSTNGWRHSGRPGRYSTGMTTIQRSTSRPLPRSSTTSSTAQSKRSSGTASPASANAKGAAKPSHFKDSIEGPRTGKAAQAADAAKARLDKLDAFFTKYEGHGKGMVGPRILASLNTSAGTFPPAGFEDPKFLAKLNEGLQRHGISPTDLYALTNSGDPAREKLAKLVAQSKPEKTTEGRDPRINFAREVARRGDTATLTTLVATLSKTDKKLLSAVTQLFTEYGAASPGGQQAIADVKKLKASSAESIVRGREKAPLSEMAEKAKADPAYAEVFTALAKAELSPKAVGEILYEVLADDEHNAHLPPAVWEDTRRSFAKSLIGN
jgi:hypothetical protein